MPRGKKGNKRLSNACMSCAACVPRLLTHAGTNLPIGWSQSLLVFAHALSVAVRHAQGLRKHSAPFRTSSSGVQPCQCKVWGLTLQVPYLLVAAALNHLDYQVGMASSQCTPTWACRCPNGDFGEHHQRNNSSPSGCTQAGQCHKEVGEVTSSNINQPTHPPQQTCV